MPTPGPQNLRRRTVSGRIKMLLVLLACAAPVLASYFTYYVIRPEGRSNYGTLMQPTRTMPDSLALRTLDGQPVEARSLRHQWLLVVVGSGAWPGRAALSHPKSRPKMQASSLPAPGRPPNPLPNIRKFTPQCTPPNPSRAQVRTGTCCLGCCCWVGPWS